MSHIVQGHPRWMSSSGRVLTKRGAPEEGKPNHSSILAARMVWKGKKTRHQKMIPPRSVGVQCATGEVRRNNSRENNCHSDYPATVHSVSSEVFQGCDTQGRVINPAKCGEGKTLGVSDSIQQGDPAQSKKWRNLLGGGNPLPQSLEHKVGGGETIQTNITYRTNQVLSF